MSSFISTSNSNYLQLPVPPNVGDFAILHHHPEIRPRFSKADKKRGVPLNTKIREADAFKSTLLAL